LEMLPPPAPKRPAPEDVASSGTLKTYQFRGCVMDELYKNVNDATTRILKVNGCEVVFPEAQGCCGALHAHAGYREDARRLARLNIDAFDDGADTPIVVNAAGCGAIMKEYGELLADDDAYAERATAFSSRVKDFSEFLAERDLVQGAKLSGRVAYDAPCHLHHAQRVQTAPIDVIGKAIPELDFAVLRNSERCCGSGGIYNLTHSELAADVLVDKLDAVDESGADVIVTANPGCQMQIQAGARQRGLDVQVKHVVELIDDSYAASGAYDPKA
jgi:glycolate oxidase iron-sulfur subunit